MVLSHHLFLLETFCASLHINKKTPQWTQSTWYRWYLHSITCFAANAGHLKSNYQKTKYNRFKSHLVYQADTGLLGLRSKLTSASQAWRKWKLKLRQVYGFTMLKSFYLKATQCFLWAHPALTVLPPTGIRDWNRQGFLCSVYWDCMTLLKIKYICILKLYFLGSYFYRMIHLKHLIICILYLCIAGCHYHTVS